MTAEETEYLKRQWRLAIEFLNTGFPKLSKSNHHVTSPPDRKYNCIAWAVEESKNRWWWPAVDAYWPPSVPMSDDINSFHLAYATLGYSPIKDSEIPKFTSVIALMGNGNTVKHAMKLLKNGMWSSKLGPLFDISHELNSLDGPQYGHVIGFMGKDPK